MKSVGSILLVTIICSCQPQKNKIYEWRGEDRAGIYPDTALLKEWPEEGPKEIWSTDGLGNGYGSPVFVDDQFFITGVFYTSDGVRY